MSARNNMEQSRSQTRGAESLHPPALPRTPYLPQSLWGVLCGGGGGGGSSRSVATHVSPLLSTPRLSSSPSSLDPPPPALPLTLLPEFCSNSPSDHLLPGLRRKRRRRRRWGRRGGGNSTGAPTQVPLRFPQRFRGGSHSGGGGTIRCEPDRHAAAAQTQPCHCSNSVRTVSSTHLADGGGAGGAWGGGVSQSRPTICL